MPKTFNWSAIFQMYPTITGVTLSRLSKLKCVHLRKRHWGCCFFFCKHRVSISDKDKKESWTSETKVVLFLIPEVDGFGGNLDLASVDFFGLRLVLSLSIG